MFGINTRDRIERLERHVEKLESETTFIETLIHNPYKFADGQKIGKITIKNKCLYDPNFFSKRLYVKAYRCVLPNGDEVVMEERYLVSVMENSIPQE